MAVPPRDGESEDHLVNGYFEVARGSVQKDLGPMTYKVRAISAGFYLDDWTLGSQLDNLPIIQLLAGRAESTADAVEAGLGGFLEGEERRGRTLEFEA
jgi:hypothetical protein